MASRWRDQVVFITGASSGLGEGLALELARRGAKVGLMARRDDQLKEIAARIEAAGGKAAVARCDVGDRAQVEHAVAALKQALGSPDLLIANAGMNNNVRMSRFDVAKVEEVLRINLLGALYAIGAVLPAMVEQRRGHIAGVSSIAAFRGLPGSGPYSASKAGLSTLLESLRIDLRPFGIAVTTIHPGFVRTPMTASHKFPMPFLVDLDRAVAIMVRGLERRCRRIDYPWPLVMLASLGRLFPQALWDFVGGWGNRAVPLDKR